MTIPRRSGHKWQPIEDLPDDWVDLCTPELGSLLEVWTAQKAKLSGSKALLEFQERMIRKWSIETGIIERIYTLDEGVTLTLIEKGFDSAFISHGDSDLPAEELVEILEDHKEAAEGLFAFVRNERPLTETYIRSLHQIITRHQLTTQGIDSLGSLVDVELQRGKYKTLPNNPGDPRSGKIRHEYCPPEHVDSEMQRLIAFHLQHSDVPHEIEAAWLHHRFTQIHPFQDGNGRIARTLATLVCLRAGAFPLIVNRQHKADYISALESADEGDLMPLVDLFRRQQKDAFVQALGLSQQALERQLSLDAIISDARERLEQAMLHKVDAVNDHAVALALAARGRLQSVADLLETEVGSRVRGLDARCFHSSESNAHYFRGQIIETARRLGYYANLSGPRHWVRLRIRHETVTDIVVAIHHLGHVEDGVMVASAFLSQRDRRTDEGEESHALPYRVKPICDDLFTFTSGRDRADLMTTFQDWLEPAIQVGLDIWRRTL